MLKLDQLGNEQLECIDKLRLLITMVLQIGIQEQVKLTLQYLLYKEYKCIKDLLVICFLMIIQNNG
jgi:hypothetical protein